MSTHSFEGLVPHAAAGTRLARAVAAALIVASAGCDEPATGVPPSAAPSYGVTYTTSGTDSTWNYYSADVVLSMEGDYAGFEYPDAYRSVSMHVERTLAGDGNWHTVNTLDPLEPMGPIPANGSHYAIGRTEHDDASTYFRMYDRQGNLIPEDPLGPDFPPAGGLGYRPDSAAPLPEYPEHPGGPPPPDECFDHCEPEPSGSLASLRTTGASDSSGREWLDNVVVTPAARARNAARVLQRYGRAMSTVRGMDRYARKRGEMVLEILIDPVLGAVAEESMTVGGRRVARVTYSYSMVRPGIYVRHLARTEINPGPHAVRPLVMEARTTNVRVEERSNQP
jgi:hypothetical protein